MRQISWLRWVVVAALALFAAVWVLWFRNLLTLETLARHEQSLKRFAAEQPLLVYALAFALYVAVTGLSLPGAGVMSLAYGWFFGFWRALILVNFAATTGATIAFLLSRYLLRDAVQRRFGQRLERFNQAFAKEGAFYLFALRLTPAAPFFVINLVMALTPIRTWTFWWVSQLGMLPGGAVFAYAGSSVPELQALADKGVGAILTPQLAVAFIILGLLPLALRKLLRLES